MINILLILGAGLWLVLLINSPLILRNAYLETFKKSFKKGVKHDIN